MKLTLGTDSQARKDADLVGGFDNYFPAAAAGVARHSKRGNDKHNPGQPLHWSRGKSMDHDACVRRHGVDIQDIEAAIERDGETPELINALLEEHDARCWRSMAASQQAYEKYAGAPLAPAARLPVQEPKPGTVTKICGATKDGMVCTGAPGHLGGHHL